MGFFETEKNFLLAWFISGGFTVFLPLFMFMIARVTNSAQDDNQNNNNNNNNNGEESGCKWWQWGCSNGNEEEKSSPWWWFGGADDQPEAERTSGSLIFIYIWSLLVFAGILYLGPIAIRKKRDFAVIVGLIFFANLCFMSLFFLGGLEGAIETEGAAVEEDGWYGQFGVMMYMTNVFWMLFAIVFIFIVRNRAANNGKVTHIEIDPEDYHICGDSMKQTT